MEIDSILSIVNRKPIETTSAELTDNVLSINCRKCSKVPDVRSPVCMKCMMHHISQHGNAERIRMRTSRDLELFGSAAETICELAVFYRMSAAGTNKGGRSCSDCSNSCSKIMEMIWSGFPDPNFDSARGRLAAFRPSESGCNVCIQRTYRAIDQAEYGINVLKKKISIETARAGGV